MKKKSPPPPTKSEFRESDFFGIPPQEKTQLSGALNRLSEQLANTRQLLQDIEHGAPLEEGSGAPLATPASAPSPPVPAASGEPAAQPAPVKPNAPTPSDDGTPVPP